MVALADLTWMRLKQALERYMVQAIAELTEKGFNHSIVSEEIVFVLVLACDAPNGFSSEIDGYFDLLCYLWVGGVVDFPPTMFAKSNFC